MRDLTTLALNRSGVAAVVLNQSGGFVFVANLPDCWKLPTSDAPTHQLVFGDEISGRLAELTQQISAGGEPETFQITGPDGRYFEFGLDRVSVGAEWFLLHTIIELTEEHRREQRLRALLRELNHRSKNLLAIILSVASQTARSTSGLADFLQKFRGRVYSISHSQDLITDANWHGARFRTLVRSQADKYHERPEESLALEGIDPMLSPNEALHIGLAIHELFVDAIAVGELSGDLPSISVSCTQQPYDGAPGLEIIWRQTNPSGFNGEDPLVDKADGFHSTVLSRIAPIAVGGEGTYEMRETGPFYRIHFPQPDSHLKSI
ncbi:MAG: sensor histidine kinase [Rhizobiaceae bacterium]